MNFYAYIRKSHSGSYYVVLPAKHVRDALKDRGWSELPDKEVKVEVTL